MRNLVWGLISLMGAANMVMAAEPMPLMRSIVVVRGASGTPEYGQQFDAWAQRWIDAAKRGGLQIDRLGPLEQPPQSASATATANVTANTAQKVAQNADQSADRARLKTLLEAASDDRVSELWLVFVGHGTFDGKTARFNLQGDDVSAVELAQWLSHRKTRTVVVNTASASGPFLDTLRGPERVVVTATKSGSEQNFARFGDYLSAAIGNATHDLDKDGQTSLFEAFLVASRQTEEFYNSDGRLPTEHALLDDNADGAGIRANWFRGLRLIQKPDHGHAADGAMAHQTLLVLSPSDQQLDPAVRQERDALVRSIIALRSKKADFPSVDEYFNELEKLCLKLAELEAKASSKTTPAAPKS
jgi:hypothetical protein